MRYYKIESGNVKKFVNNLTMQNEMGRYNGHLYYFYGIRYDTERKIYYTSIDHFEKEFYYYESDSLSEYLEHLLSDKYWNGKRFL